MSKCGVRARLLGLCTERASAWAMALIALVAGGLLTAALAFAAHTFYKQQLRQRFELLASERASRIAERFDEQQQRLEHARRGLRRSIQLMPRHRPARLIPLVAALLLGGAGMPLPARSTP